MKIRRIATIARPSLAIILISVFTICSALGQTAACTDRADNSSSVYPRTPRGAVEAFIKAALGNVPITVEQMRLCGEVVDVQRKYFPDDEDVKPNHKTHVMDLGKNWGPNHIRYHVATGFEIAGVAEHGNTAEVRVLYRRFGWITKDPMYVTECRSTHLLKDKQNTNASGLVEAMTKLQAEQRDWVWDKKGLPFLARH